MGMSTYIMDLEDKFLHKDIPEIIKECETVEEAIDKAHKRWIFNYDLHSAEKLEEIVTEQWNEFWSQYN